MTNKQQSYDYFVTVVFQTALVPDGRSHRKEIVEVNAVAVHSLNVDRQKAFAGCCHPELADCTFGDTLRKFAQWLNQLNGPFILVTDNYNALALDFRNQCLRSGYDMPPFATTWLNVTEFWRRRYGNREQVTVDQLLEHFGKNRVLDKGKRTSQCNARSLAIVTADIVRIHRAFSFKANEGCNEISIVLDVI
ncbi:uncharacterized protein LOC130692959 [Daphnia carinata]|uniref:uncharacterized protein LOC130692959 n=1 Tax=Daphnia carinata TaxID=120202 RepID=UPI00257C6E13|nr:uncharacterized protein LOC130692959 [Daphnia carinata]XP_059350314.1 uncharacterized protein LOC130692959 [Daphnia carinata]